MWFGNSILNLIKFSKENQINLSNYTLEEFLNFYINNSLYKIQSDFKNYIYEFIELYISKLISTTSFEFFNYFVTRIENTKKFNLSEEILFLEFKEKCLNE